MKNNFTKIMQENLELNEDYKASMNYYNAMYGYRRIKSQETLEKELKAEEEKKKSEIAAEEKRDEEAEIEEEISDYLEAYEKIQDDYEEYAYNIDGEIDEIKEKIKLESDPTKLLKLKKEKIKLDTKLSQYQRKAEFKLHSLNNKLSAKAKKELKERGEFHKDIDEVDLSESTIFDSSLSVLEEKFIFGNMLENIEDITLMETSTDVLSGEKIDQGAAKQLNNAERSTGAAEARVQAAERTGNQTKINKAKMGATRANLTQIKVNALVMKEADENPIIAAKEKVIAAKTAAKAKEEISSTQDQTSVDNQTATTMTEAAEQNYNPIKDRIDFNNFSATLFNGGSGNALKYLLKGEINNGNITEIEIAKFMKDKPEVQQVIKKLKFYLRKTASGLSYEEYIDLKVQKGKFRTLFGDAKKEYANRFKK